MDAAGPQEGAPELALASARAEGAEGEGSTVRDLASLPDGLLVEIWPRDRLIDGMLMGSREITRALLSAPRLTLRSKNLVRGGFRAAQAHGGLARLLGSMTCLEELNLANNRIGHEAAAMLFPHLPSQLRHLSLAHNCLLEGDYAALVPLLPPGLTSLDLGCNWIRAPITDGLPSGLRHLNLGGNYWTNIRPYAINIADFQVLSRLTSLLHLDLKDCSLGDAGAKVLGPFLPSTLQHLELGSNEIGDEGVISLSTHLPKTLLHLGLGRNMVGDVGAATLGPRLPSSLQELNLSFNLRLGREGVLVLVGSISRDRLEQLCLNIRGTFATDALQRSRAGAYEGQVCRFLQLFH